MTLLWYALRSKPNKEDALWREVCARGHEAYLPRLKVQTINPRARQIRPYFPGYLFVHVDMPQVGFSSFAWLPYARGLVYFGGDPSHIPDELIQAIRRRVDEVNAAGGEQLEGLKRGDVVAVQSGPFAGYEAIFDTRLSGDERVRVLLTLLQKRQLALELPAGYIQQKNRP